MYVDNQVITKGAAKAAITLRQEILERTASSDYERRFVHKLINIMLDGIDFVPASVRGELIEMTTNFELHACEGGENKVRCLRCGAKFDVKTPIDLDLYKYCPHCSSRVLGISD